MNETATGSIAKKEEAIHENRAKNNKLYGLDHLRAFAILFVFLFHYGAIFSHPQWTQTLGWFGWTGVDLFFVLSGYLIASQLFRGLAKGEAISFKTFFLKRFFRIVPAYLVVVALYFCFPFIREASPPAPLWKYLTFTQNLGLDLHKQKTFSHAWSLCVEEQFYLMFPLFLILLSYLRILKKGGWLILFLFVAGFVIRYVLYQHFVVPHLQDDDAWAYWHEAIYYPTPCRLDGLLTGVAIAAMMQFLPALAAQITKQGNLLFITSLCLLAVAFYVCTNRQSYAASMVGFPLVAIGYGVMVLSAVSPTCFLYKIKSNLTSAIAALSYAIYLTHKFIIHVAQTELQKLSISNNSNLMFLLCCMFCLCGALLMNKAVEKPFLKWRDRIIKGQKS